ncbi:hypothetical protein NDU88_005604 [Pleurodeles waltl]|uniref:MADF domain-containing protein n=1 Tax=Pleurodeles waltl TaxID=8319 RepID=A0AAV7PG68_PLEWA|nr:hypothetical protein NDU88_005604 [Pleurodeles waltl]
MVRTTADVTAIFYLFTHLLHDLQERTYHCMCCPDLWLEPTMARVTGERAPAFTSTELERLVDGVLPQYRKLYGPPDQQVSTHQKKGIWRAISKDVRTLGVYGRRSAHCRKRKDMRPWAWKTAEAQLGMASQQGRGARRTLTPLMACILAVAYPEMDECLGASQQPQGGEYSAPIYMWACGCPLARPDIAGRKYSPWPILPALVFIMKQKVDEHGEDMQHRLRGVMVVP